MTTATAEPGTTPPLEHTRTRAEQQDGSSPMTHRQILEALSGMLLGLFVAILSSTVVSNALPTILSDLGGGETAYTWVVTATLLTTTVTTPIWGKLSDLFSKKLLVQLSLIIFVVSSAVAGLSTSTAMLITCRAFQGIGVGGLTALTQVILAAMISPRERGRYAGYLGAVFALATVTGPLIGGVLVDTSWLGWRWCFYVGVPFALIGLVVLQRTLHLPTVKREVKIDYLGATLLTGGVSLLLVWVSLAGKNYAWGSVSTAVMVGGAVVLLLLTLLAEHRAVEPIIPLRLFRSRTVAASSVASLLVGITLFGATVFLAQYFQISRGVSATMSGIMTLPFIGGLFVSSTVVGRIISATGKWKRYMVLGGVLLVAGFALMATARQDTEYVLLAVYMALIGLGVGMLLQNLVLAVQNTVSLADLGSASSTVVFFRSLGGALGVSALGAALSSKVTSVSADGFAALGIDPAAAGEGGAIPDVKTLPGPIAEVIQGAYGQATGFVFLIAAPIALLALVAVLIIKEVPLRTSTTDETPATPAPEQEPVAPAETAEEAPVDGSTVRGRVLGPDGAPVSGATLTLTDLGGRQLDLTRTADDGTYTLRTADGGTFLLVCAAEQLQPTASMVTVAGPRTTRDVTLEGAGRVRGTISGAGGYEVPGARVSITDVRGQVVAAVVTGDDGSYALDGLYAGQYTVAVSAAGSEPAARTVTVDQSADAVLDVTLVSVGEVSGTVRAASDGRAVPEATVTLVDAGGTVVSTVVTDAGGRYKVADLRPGDYTVIATGYAPAASRVQVTGGRLDGADVLLRTAAAQADAEDTTPSRHAAWTPAPEAPSPVTRNGSPVAGE